MAMPSRVLLSTPELTLGEFACASGDRLWDEVNDIGGRAHVVFPRTPVVIEQDGAHPVLVTPNDVVYYRPHQRYRRELRDARPPRTSSSGSTRSASATSTATAGSTCCCPPPAAPACISWLANKGTGRARRR
jgi:hypothetical protein